MPEPCAGHSKNWVFWAELVNSGSPVPAGWTCAAAGCVRATAHATAPRQISRIRMHGRLPAGLPRDIPVSWRTGSGFFAANPGVIPLGSGLVEEALLDQPRALLRRDLDVARREQEDLVGDPLHAAVERVGEAGREVDQAHGQLVVGPLEVEDDRDRLLELVRDVLGVVEGLGDHEVHADVAAAVGR